MSSNIRINKVCSFCKQTFVAKTFSTKYCSHKCNSRDYKMKVKIEKLEKSKEEFIQTIKLVKLKKQELDLETLKTKSYLSIAEVCALVNISDSTIRKLIKEEKIKSIRLGKKHIIPKSQLDDLLN
jgi:excisionase family DNA binding protein